VIDAQALTGNNLKAFNSFEAPQRVTPQPAGKPAINGNRTAFEVPARSYTVIQWEA
jgi:alpha-L-arabinofuranosidase